MKNRFFIIFLIIISLAISSFEMHKFYVSVTQINFAQDKKTIQITSRIFIDDLNNALEKKYKKKFYIGSTKETEEEIQLLKNYFSENFSIKVNSKTKPTVFLDKEIEDDVIILYHVIRDVSKINSLEIKNTLLFDFLPEQQHIIHTQISGKKLSALLTFENRTELLNY
ncbi:DUF6702 family protein [Flavobacterium lacus]|uniref:Peptidase E n=1 Tax=Flavobacterium lacus TaxID=1353778 RepID=A0A328WVD5_9FLAO|nr:DUF6702 family protein [Flavobacterium lacus]RAR47814.1 hypothetical protein B0I10_10790 [Flavobacterium lacus]